VKQLASVPDLKTIVFRLGCSYRQRLDALLAEAGVVATTSLEFGSTDAILACVAAGVGITLLPKGIVSGVAQADTIAVHTLPPRKANVETLLIRRHDSYVSSAMIAFIEAARNSFGQVRVAA
jgi:DNA-binding transcriptional LysR family regulator